MQRHRALLQQLLLVLLLLLLHHGGSHTAAALPMEAGSIDPAEVQARAQKLLAENLQPTLDYWHRLATARGGRKLTMQHFFKTTAKLRSARPRHTYSWGVLNGRMVQLDREGEVRYSADAMIKEKIPNPGAADTMKGSFWLAIEDALARGVRLPNVLFSYNMADGPQCNTRSMSCDDGTHAPPLSIMSMDAALLENRVPKAPTMFPDLLVPMFKNVGYSMSPSVGKGSMYHAKVVARIGRGGPAWVQRNLIDPSVAWEDKSPVMYFRGMNYCPHQKLPICPRQHLANLSFHHPDKLDLMCNNGLSMKVYEAEVKEHAPGMLPFASHMKDWPKYKYIASIDGLAGSNRLLPLLHMGSTIVRQHRSPNLEWYYKSLKSDVQFVEIFKPKSPGGPPDYNDAPDLVDRLRADDAGARAIAQRGLEFAQKYLVKDVMLAYLKGVLDAYKDLFEDMDEYIAKFGDPGNPTQFLMHVKNWQQDWRMVAL